METAEGDEFNHRDRENRISETELFTTETDGTKLGFINSISETP